MERIHLKPHSRSQGLALLSVLWLTAILAALVAVAARSVRLDARISLAAAEQVRGKWACRSGVEKALALLHDDLSNVDSLSDVWSDNPEDCNDILLERCVLTIRITDEARKLNINTATKNQLMQLPDMTDEIADALIDWRDENTTPEPHGAEGNHYRTLQPPYEIRNGPFLTLREMLLVKEVTPALLYGEDTNLNGRLDPHENDGDTTPPVDNADNILDVGWYPHLTCYSYDNNKDAQGNPRININTADENKLTEALNLKKAYARWIVENRGEGFKTIADLIDEDSPKKATDDQSEEAQKIDLETYAGLVDKITVKDDTRLPGRININTASERVLLALFEGEQKLAQALLTYRQSQPYGIQNVGDLLKIKSVPLQDAKKIIPLVTTRSHTFNIDCRALSERTRALFHLEAVVDRNPTPAEIIYLHQGENL